jgi:hypothetical protein
MKSINKCSSGGDAASNVSAKGDLAGYAQTLKLLEPKLMTLLTGQA